MPRLRLILALACLTVVASIPAKSLTLDDGLVHEINLANSFPADGVTVRDGPGSTSTTVNVVTGGEISTFAGAGLGAFDSSHINVSGGAVGG